MNAVPFKITARAAQVLQLVLEGHTDRAVGKTLGISPRTVKSHRHALYLRGGIEGGNKRVTR